MKAPKAAYRFWGDTARPSTKTEFFNAVTTLGAPAGGNIATIRLYGPIDSWGGLWGVSAKDVAMVLDSLDSAVDQIILRVNSPGGEVFEGMAILNLLRAHKAKVLAVVDALAGSAASVIVAGCDETVMSPGTWMAIHKPSGITFGNADDLRQDADVLDTLEASLTTIYQAKAGDQDWAALLAATTWMTAEQTVDLGLADRVAVIPDAGETATAGDAPPLEVVVIDPSEGDDDPEDIIASLHKRYAASVQPQTPVSTEPVEPQKKEDRVSDTLKAGLRERLGVTDADASDETLLAAIDEALEERAETPTAETPDGVVMVDKAQFETLTANAAAGLEARNEQRKADRERIVTDAMADGRIAPVSKQTWLDALEKDADGAAALIATLAKNTVPVTELGGQPAEATGEDALYYSLFPDEDPSNKKGA